MFKKEKSMPAPKSEKIQLHELETKRLKILAQKDIEYRTAMQFYGNDPERYWTCISLINKKLGNQYKEVIDQSLDIIVKTLSPDELDQLRELKKQKAEKLKLSKAKQAKIQEQIDKEEK